MADKDKKKDNIADVSGNDSEKKEKKSKKDKKSSLGKRILKISAWTLSSLLAVLVLLFIFRDPVIKFGVTSIGSWVTGVEIELDSIVTKLDGSVHLKGLRVGNPNGFALPEMVDLEEFNLKIDIPSLTSQEIIIENLEVKNLLFTAEFDKKTNFNVTTLVKNLEQRFPPPAEPPADDSKTNEPDTQEQSEADSAPQQAVMIRNLAVSIKLILAHDLSGAELTAPISYSTTDLQVVDDGKEHWTKKLADAAAELESWCKACFNAGEFIVTAGMEAVEGIGNVLKDGFNSGKKVLEGGKKVLDGGKNLFNSATDIFRKK